MYTVIVRPLADLGFGFWSTFLLKSICLCVGVYVYLHIPSFFGQIYYVRKLRTQKEVRTLKIVC